MSDHDIGDMVRLWMAFYNEAGAQAAPSTVTLTVEPPSGTSEDVDVEPAIEADLDIASTAVGTTLATITGVYKATVTVDEAGTYWYRWEGTGAVIEVEEGWFQVRLRQVAAVVP